MSAAKACQAKAFSGEVATGSPATMRPSNNATKQRSSRMIRLRDRIMLGKA
jgi:hypothetical protein